MSSIIEIMKGNKMASIPGLTLFNAIIFLSIVFEIDTILALSGVLLYTFVQQVPSDYSQLETKDRHLGKLNLDM